MMGTTAETAKFKMASSEVAGCPALMNHGHDERAGFCDATSSEFSIVVKNRGLFAREAGGQVESVALIFALSH